MAILILESVKTIHHERTHVILCTTLIKESAIRRSDPVNRIPLHYLVVMCIIIHRVLPYLLAMSMNVISLPFETIVLQVHSDLQILLNYLILKKRMRIKRCEPTALYVLALYCQRTTV